MVQLIVAPVDWAEYPSVDMMVEIPVVAEVALMLDSAAVVELTMSHGLSHRYLRCHCARS